MIRPRVRIPVRPNGRLAWRKLRERGRQLARFERARHRAGLFEAASGCDLAGLAEDREAVVEGAPASAEVRQPLLVALEAALRHAQVGAVTVGPELEAQHAPVGRLELYGQHAPRHQFDDRAAEVERGVVQSASRGPVREREAPRAALAHVGDGTGKEPATQVGRAE